MKPPTKQKGFETPVVLTKEDGRGPDHPDFRNPSRAFDLNGPAGRAEARLARDEADVGQRFRLEIQRHRERPKLWRLRVHHVAADGSESTTATEWREFPDFSPDLLLAQGRLKRFIFGNAANVPSVQRRT